MSLFILVSIAIQKDSAASLRWRTLLARALACLAAWYPGVIMAGKLPLALDCSYSSVYFIFRNHTKATCQAALAIKKSVQIILLFVVDSRRWWSAQPETSSRSSGSSPSPRTTSAAERTQTETERPVWIKQMKIGCLLTALCWRFVTYTHNHFPCYRMAEGRDVTSLWCNNR